ncbi:unnamed protein product, partial [Nippostrongylus brasiliensis]|uniref:Probable cytochrome P450 CYP36A1 (inferred by orthology to a C. elegans protein) n=1 Tax=Nippostrongylus brasiliensis TaxID=27835 RepID=A0A0N4YVZ6_NIPBR
MEGIDVHLLRLKKIYGDVFTLWLPFPTVVIGGHEALKRTIVRDGESYAGRPDTYIMVLLVQGNYGLLFEENDWYRSQRRFTIQTLKNLGVGKDAIKKTISLLAHRTVEILGKSQGEPLELRHYLTNAVGNVINQLAFGYVRPPEDTEIVRFQFLLNEVFEHFNSPKMLLLDVVPFLRHFDHFLGLGIESTLHGNDAILEFIQKEITMDDQKILPYTCAFLQEVYRAGYVVSVNFLRITTEDVECEGYKLRRGTRVIPQFPSVHMDESIYPRPELIIPERHLKDGQYIKDDRITAFSVGKRACLGENLARMEVFTFFATLMQKFRFEPEGLYPPAIKMQ